MKILSKLFRDIQASRASDGLRQTEREAILDLLLYCTYADNHLSLAEDQVVKDEVDRFDWDSGTTPELYIATATDRVRRARSDLDAEKELFAFISERLPSEESKGRAKALMEKLFHSDGETAAEKAFSQKVASYLG